MTIAGLEGTDPVVCSRNVVIKPDVSFDEAVAKDYDVVICPGGMQGSENMAAVSLQVLLLPVKKKSSILIVLTLRRVDCFSLEKLVNC